MRVFTCNDFEGHYPVGSAAVVVAEDEDAARVALRRELRSMGLELRKGDKLIELDVSAARVVVLNDGDY